MLMHDFRRIISRYLVKWLVVYVDELLGIAGKLVSLVKWYSSNLNHFSVTFHWLQMALILKKGVVVWLFMRHPTETYRLKTSTGLPKVDKYPSN